MTTHYQFGSPDGDLDFSPGQPVFASMWQWAEDYCRFHRGKGFTLFNRTAGRRSQVYGFKVLGDRLKAALDVAHEDGIVDVRSEFDGWKLSFRRHQVSVDKGQLMVDFELRLLGQPYVLGGLDCSGLTQRATEQVADITLPHKADWQYHDSHVIPIARSKALRGDLVFIHYSSYIRHVATVYDGVEGNMRVVDTQPHDAVAPAGWSTRMLGTGVRIRPAYGNYYCAQIVGFGRIAAVNGSP